MVENLTEDLELSGISKGYAESATPKSVPDFYSNLSKCKSKHVVMSLITPYAESYVLSSQKIPTLMDLFKKENLELPYNELLHFCQSIHTEVTKEQIDQVQKDTISQLSGTNFYRHRAGRIGASQSKAVAHSDPGTILPISNTANLLS